MALNSALNVATMQTITSGASGDVTVVDGCTSAGDGGGGTFRLATPAPAGAKICAMFAQIATRRGDGQ